MQFGVEVVKKIISSCYLLLAHGLLNSLVAQVIIQKPFGSCMQWVKKRSLLLEVVTDLFLSAL